MTAASSRILLGHDDTFDIDGHRGEGVDLLLTIYIDDTDDLGTEHHTLAVRPGKDQRRLTWGPPVDLHPEPAS